MKRFNQEKSGNKRAKRFNPTVSFLIVGTLVITAFFRGTVSHILLIILFAGCALYKLLKYAKEKIIQARHRAECPPWQRPSYRNHCNNDIHVRKYGGE